jgi:hypothetical protein
MNKKSLLLVLGLGLILVGVFKPTFIRSVINKPDVIDSIVVITPPSDQALLDACSGVITCLKSGDSSRIADGRRLSSLYMDLSTLIDLNGDKQIIRNTEEIRQANSLSGVMLKLNIKDKYPGLAEAANTVIVTGIGDDTVLLDENLRAKASESFRALAWACNEGAK